MKYLVLVFSFHFLGIAHGEPLLTLQCRNDALPRAQVESLSLDQFLFGPLLKMVTMNFKRPGGHLEFPIESIVSTSDEDCKFTAPHGLKLSCRNDRRFQAKFEHLYFKVMRTHENVPRFHLARIQGYKSTYPYVIYIDERISNSDGKCVIEARDK